MPVLRTVKDARAGTIRLEAIHQPLYDSAEITAAGTVNFFQTPGNRGKFASNLQTPGQLSWPKRFSIKAVRQVPASTAPITDLQTFLSDSYYDIVVGEKTYLTLPAFMITAGVGLEVQFVEGAAAPLAPANGVSYANMGRPNQQNIYSLIHSIYIPPVQNFTVALVIGAAAAPAAPFNLHLFLEGELLREVQ